MFCRFEGDKYVEDRCCSASHDGFAHDRVFFGMIWPEKCRYKDYGGFE